MALRNICRLALLIGCLFLSIARSSPPDLWSLRPIDRPEVPAAQTSHPIDAFINQKLAEKGLQPVGPAARATLLRRVYFDLIGLPPTPAELKAFLRDSSPDAYEKVVDRLLGNEQHGVRYARHWLDVLRYTDVDESMAFESGAYMWRDWVIRALNNDLPYDEFARAQLMGDASDKPGDLFATGFLSRGGQSPKDEKQELAFAAAETAGAAFLGMTVGCAKCHDHMYDPISQRDYYSMKALFDPLVLDKRIIASQEQIFAHSQAVEAFEARKRAVEEPMNALIGEYKQRLYEERVETLPVDVQAVERKPEMERTPEEQKVADDYAPILRIDPPKIKEVMTAEEVEKYEAFLDQLKEIEKSRPADPPTFWTVREDAKRLEEKSHILMTGDPEKPQDEVSPGFPFAPENLHLHAGRRQGFVKWLTAPENPLFARVPVNRIWQWHFGEALAGTPNDFGNMGRRPTHPELLDWLASEFQARHYSMKALHRLIVTSDAYKRASTGPADLLAANEKIDRQGDYLWRFRLRRLEAECVYDAVHSASGDLDLTVGGKSFRAGALQKRLGSNKVIGNFDERTNRRGVYMGRGYVAAADVMPAFLRVFDAEDGVAACPRRQETVTAPQALLLMNSEVVDDASRKFAARLNEQTGDDLSAAVDLAFRIALSRKPSSTEKDEALTYLEGDRARLPGFAWLLMNLDEFVYLR